MTKKSVFCLLFILLFPVVIAVPNSDNVRDMLGYLNEFKEEYNKNIEKVPGWVKSILGSEKLNATLFLNDDSAVNIGIIFDGGAIVEMRQGRLKEPTINLYITEDEIIDILAVDGYNKRLARLKSYYDASLIRYNYATFRSKVKFGTVGLAYGLFAKVRQ